MIDNNLNDIRVEVYKNFQSFDEQDENVNKFTNDDNKKNLKMDKIIPRLYISDDIVARNREILKTHKITHILNLTANIPNKYEPEIKYLKLTILDFESQNISQYFDESFEFIENALKDEKNSVLVHCNAGISRSASFIIAYLMQKGVFKHYKDAYNHVKKCRSCICPNKGFEKQLHSLNKRIKRRNMCLLM